VEERLALSTEFYTLLKSTFSGLQFCRRHYGFICIHLAIVAFRNRDITRNSDKIRPYSSSRSSKVIDLGVNRKLICNFLLVININLFEAPARGNPLECRDEIWYQKTRTWGYQMVKNFARSLAFFVLIQYRRNMDGWTDRQTDGRTDTLLSQRPALAYRRVGNKKAVL